MVRKEEAVRQPQTRRPPRGEQVTERTAEQDGVDSSTQIIREAVRLLVEAAHPVKVILFGSFARGDNTKDSDLDFLVILPTVTDHHAEMVRLRRALAALPMPIDVLVYSVDEVQRRGHLRGTTLYHALNEGKVLHAAA
jgi:predicted nucleotidyltransferase